MNRYEKLSQIFKKHLGADYFAHIDLQRDVAELLRDTAIEQYDKGAEMAKLNYRPVDSIFGDSVDHLLQNLDKIKTHEEKQ